ncbi:MAG: hypothetical protein OHK0039_46940 [Bacteroidia bacterium]
MHRLLCLTLLLAASPLLAQQQLTLAEALARQAVEIIVRGNGGFHGPCITIAIRPTGNEPLAVAIPAGHIFDSEDSTVQNLMVTHQEVIALTPGASKRATLQTMCTQSYNTSPGRGERFRAGQMADGLLLRLAQVIDSAGYQNSTAQSAVWSVANREPVSNIYASDVEIVRQLAPVVSEATGTPLTDFIYEPRPHQITSISTSIECLIPRNLRQAHLALYSADGTEIRRYFEGRRIERGFMQWRVGAYHTLGDSAELYLRLVEDGEVIAQKQVFATDTIVPLQRYETQAVLVFDTHEDLDATVGVYDAEGNLYFVIESQRRVLRGTHRSTFIIGKDLPRDQPYFIAVKSGDQTLASTAIRHDGPAPAGHPKRRLQGTLEFRQDTLMRNVRLAIYDSEGRLKRVMYDIAVLNAGNKRFSYDFEHIDGPGAVFYFRLTDADGQVLMEREVKDE